VFISWSLKKSKKKSFTLTASSAILQKEREISVAERVPDMVDSRSPQKNEGRNEM